MSLFRIAHLFLALALSFSVFGQQPDSLILSNGNIINGEAKSMDRGVLTYDADYADSDFKIDWDKVSEIYTSTKFLFTLSNGDRYNGHLETDSSGKIVIVTEDGNRIATDKNDIVFMDDMDEGFWSQLYASIDIGIDLTKANNFSQISMRSIVGFDAKRWGTQLSYNSLYSSQDNVENIRRVDGGARFNYFLPRDWYPLIDWSFLSNTEQKLDMRNLLKLGMGKYLVHTNRSYWGFQAGANYNNENFSLDTDDRESWEAFLGTELNLYDIGDLNLLTNIVVFPSLTESGRWRSDMQFDAKYEMPFDDDFYIKIGFTVNYDNRPVEGASETDYVFHTGFGWQW
jgi:putative salt-induced outer membrane protein YdiY